MKKTYTKTKIVKYGKILELVGRYRQTGTCGSGGCNA